VSVFGIVSLFLRRSLNIPAPAEVVGPENISVQAAADVEWRAVASSSPPPCAPEASSAYARYELRGKYESVSNLLT